MGVSPRRLAGWEPVEVSTYERDTLGRVVRVVTVREPEFDAWDRARLSAARRARDAARGSHGALVSDAINPANEGRFEVTPYEDFAQRSLDNTQKARLAEYGEGANDGVLWEVRLRD